MTTQRLGFRTWSPEDLPLAMALWGNPQVTAFLGGPFDQLRIQARLDREISCLGEHRMQYWPIFQLDGDVHVGCAGLRPYRIEDHILELGFHLRPEYWGHGLAEEAGRLAIEYGFENLGASALFAGHHPANLASRQVLSKLGFRYTHDEIYPPTGELHPSYLLLA